ncbi:hypothetical protein [Cellulomonas cellasea]|uniref:Uncharacterized protein n=1 Tax=Cellulomonas cellasea TaxID=43670 RepID=A0A4Y3KTY3_9CELL|nr:hypothetical protein [Cellulomonas cellasea]GEA87879.1 hypothetical protein CCE01nite_18280 [Cellulomonas cellasea]
MTAGGVVVGRGVRSRVLVGGSLTLLIASPEPAAAERGIALAHEQLVGLNASDVGTGEGRGPSFVGRPVPVPGGLLWSLDTSGMPRRELASLLDVVVGSLVEAGAGSALVGLPRKADHAPFRGLALTPGLAMSVVAFGVRDWSDPRGAARAEAWAPLLDVGLAWLTDGGGAPPLAAVTGAGGPYALDVPPGRLHGAVAGLLAAGGGLELLRRGNDGARYVRLAAVLRPELAATWLPDVQAVPGLAAVSALTDALEAVADRLTWAAADVRPGRGTSSEGLIGYNDAPTIPSELPRHGPLAPLREDQVPGAFPWQVLNGERRARLAAVVPGADEGRLAAGRSVLRFGALDDWLPGSGRAAVRDAARQALGPAFD